MFLRLLRRTYKEIDRRPLAFVGLLLVLIAGIRVFGILEELNGIRVPDGNIRVRGIVSEIDSFGDRFKFVLETKELGKLLVYLDEPEDISLGNEVEVMGEAKEYAEPGNPGEFNLKRYYQIKGITGRIFCDRILKVNSRVRFYDEAIRRINLRLNELIREVFPDEEAGTAAAMLIGSKESLEEGVKDLYRSNGIAHLLAVSGLHVSLIGALAQRAAGKLFSNGIGGSVFAIVLVGIYAGVAGFKPPVLRAFTFFVLGTGAEAFGRRNDRITAFFLAAGLILNRNPMLFFDGGFYLSFAAAASFMVLGIFEERERNALRRMRVRGRKNIVSAKGSIVPSFMLFLFTTPIIMKCYYELPLVGTLMNILAIPLMSAFFLLGLLALALSGGNLVLGKAAGSVAVLPLRLIAFCSEKVKVIFGAPFVTGNVSLLRLFLFYGGLVLLLFFIYKRTDPLKKPSPGLLIKIFSLGVLLLSILLVKIPQRDLEITMLDVGQGECLCIRSRPGHCILIDGGSTDVSKVGQYRIIPFLKYNGIRKVDAIYVTHEDEDHISGLLELAKDPGIKVERLYLTCQAAETKAGQELIKAFEEKGEAGLFAKGDNAKSGKLTLSCLYPDKSIVPKDPNQGSMVLRLSYGSFTMLLTGDLEGEGEELLAEELKGEAFSVLKVGHHGSNNGTGETLLEAVQPSLGVISCGIDNRYSHPGKETLQRLEEWKVLVKRTDESGAIRLVTDGNSLKVSVFRTKLVKEKEEGHEK